MNTENFKKYTIDDFLMDEDFRKIVQADQTGQLNKLIENLQEKRHDIELAVRIIKAMKAGKFQQDDDKKYRLWQQILWETKKNRLHYFRYAASVLLLIGAGIGVFYALISNQQETLVSNAPPADKAVLILSDGKKIDIDSQQSTVEYSSDGQGIVVNDSADISQSCSEKALNQMTVPYGKRSYLILSEGTKVWLNSGSTLTFPPVFTGNARKVTLSGEAMFDVAKYEGSPFYVETDNFMLKVYGTKFDVCAYREDDASHIILVEGKVSMTMTNTSQKDEVFLHPNEKASLSKGYDSFEISHVENVEDYIDWVNGYLTFFNEDVSKVLKRVSRYYAVEIEHELPENMECIYGKLDLKDDLEKVLNGIAFISKTQYLKQGNKYIFTKE